MFCQENATFSYVCFIKYTGFWCNMEKLNVEGVWNVFVICTHSQLQPIGFAMCHMITRARMKIDWGRKGVWLPLLQNPMVTLWNVFSSLFFLVGFMFVERSDSGSPRFSCKWNFRNFLLQALSQHRHNNKTNGIKNPITWRFVHSCHLVTNLNWYQSKPLEKPCD